MKMSNCILFSAFTVILGVAFYFGIFNNPSFNIHDFFESLSSEFIGWILAVTLFQAFFDMKIQSRVKPGKEKNNNLNVADELLQCKNLLEAGIITQNEFDKIKNRLTADK